MDVILHVQSQRAKRRNLQLQSSEMFCRVAVSFVRRHRKGERGAPLVVHPSPTDVLSALGAVVRTGERTAERRAERPRTRTRVGCGENRCHQPGQLRVSHRPLGGKDRVGQVGEVETSWAIWSR